MNDWNEFDFQTKINKCNQLWRKMLTPSQPRQEPREEEETEKKTEKIGAILMAFRKLMLLMRILFPSLFQKEIILGRFGHYFYPCFLKGHFQEESFSRGVAVAIVLSKSNDGTNCRQETTQG